MELCHGSERNATLKDIDLADVVGAGSCAVVVKPVSRGESFDVAVTNAIKQTALNIKKACLPDTGRGAAQGAGGWQIAGAHGNLNITIFSVVDPEFSKLQRTNTKVEINQPSTLADVNYQKVVRQRTGGPMYPSMSDADFCSMGYVYDLVHGCCPGFKYVEETVTEANVETFSTILGVAYQSLLNLGKIGWCGVPGFTTTVSQTTEV
ncbi:MAG: hypothetical protein M1827_002201 [Pycnora praestabilis]|nr:MAG: hypothetical protein M1827_002201 [Pycnora praestabilis]